MEQTLSEKRAARWNEYVRQKREEPNLKCGYGLTDHARAYLDNVHGGVWFNPFSVENIKGSEEVPST